MNKLKKFVKRYLSLAGKKKIGAALLGVALTFFMSRYPEYREVLDEVKYFILTYIGGETMVDIARARYGGYSGYDAGFSDNYVSDFIESDIVTDAPPPELVAVAKAGRAARKSTAKTAAKTMRKVTRK